MTPGQKAAATRAANRLQERRYVVGPLPLPMVREDRPHLNTAQSVWQHVLPLMGGAQREIFRVLCLDARNRLLADIVVSVGSVDSCNVDPREVLAPAVVARASAIVLCHNHPSGDPTPSAQDIALTQQLKRGGEWLCIRVIDHVVVADSKFVSMSTLGMMGASFNDTQPEAA